MRLDAALPSWDFREQHSRRVAARFDAVMTAVEELTWREVPVFRALMTVRALRGAELDPDRRVLDGMVAARFQVLARGPDELVFGLEHGAISIAGNFRYDGRTLTTETRVRAADLRSRRSFRLYWLVIRPFSGLIRHEWLRAVAKRATGGHSRGR